MVRHVTLALAVAGLLACGGGGGGGGGGTGGSGSPPSAPTTYTLSGRVTTSAPALAPIQGATVAIADGPNAAKSSTTDGNGAYTLAGLQSGGFTIRASATGYDTSSQGVTLSGNQTLDFQLADTPRSLDERIAAHRFPRLGSQLQSYFPDESLLLGLGDRDLLIVDVELVANDRASAFGPRGTLRRRNRNLVVLMYFSSADVLPGNTAPVNGSFIAALQDGWFTKDTSGRRVKLFDVGGGNWSEMLNLATAVNDFMPRHLQERVVSTGLTDGIFYDWITDGVSWLNHRNPSPSGPLDLDNDGRPDDDASLDARWVAGTQTLLDNSRRTFPAGTIVAGNGGWIVGDAYDSRLNGALFEQFLEGESFSRESFGWSAIMRAYHGHCAGTVTPRLNMLMANRDAADSFTFMRFALASALMADGYFCFTNRSASYGSDWWYDEYSVDLATGRAERSLAYKGYLGTPAGPAYNANDPQERFADVLAAGGTRAEDRVWRRDFTNGTVLVNPTTRAVSIRLETAYRKIRGTVDPGFNDGQTVTDVTLPARSGMVLLTLARTAEELQQAELAGRR